MTISQKELERRKGVHRAGKVRSYRELLWRAEWYSTARIRWLEQIQGAEPKKIVIVAWD